MKNADETGRIAYSSDRCTTPRCLASILTRWLINICRLSAIDSLGGLERAIERYADLSLSARCLVPRDSLIRYSGIVKLSKQSACARIPATMLIYTPREMNRLTEDGVPRAASLGREAETTRLLAGQVSIVLVQRCIS